MLDTFPNTKSHNTPTEKEISFPVMDDLKIPIPQKDGRPPIFFEAKQTITYDNKSNKKYIRYLFDSKMACGAITGFEVYYYKCPSRTSSMTSFGHINAPTYSENVKEYQGECVENAVKVGDELLTMKCLWNGTIASMTGQCICLQGYQREGNECIKCDSQHFKPTQGNEQCTQCGLNSLSSIDRTVCNCLYKNKREVSEVNNPLAVCYRIPDTLHSFSIANITSSSLEITWSHPSQVNKTNIYIVDCKGCPSGVFPKTTTNKFITINGLGAFADYEISVTFSSEVSRMIGENQTSEFKSFKTLPGVPGMVQNLRQKTLDNGKFEYIELSWDEPFAKGNDDITYLVKYDGSTRSTTSTRYIIHEITEIDNFKVAAQVSVNGQVLVGQSAILHIKFRPVTESKNLSVGVIVTIVGLALLLFLVVGGVLVFYYRKRKFSRKAVDENNGDYMIPIDGEPTYESINYAKMTVRLTDNNPYYGVSESTPNKNEDQELAYLDLTNID
ncbi:ephrin type-A receptor 3-like [Clytia hemisphaerica]